MELDLLAKDLGIAGVGVSGDCVAHQLLHGQERVRATELMLHIESDNHQFMCRSTQLMSSMSRSPDMATAELA